MLFDGIINIDLRCLQMLKVIDLFCGIGGFSYGFLMTDKFEVVLGADVWDVALKTFENNHKGTNLLNVDLTELPDTYWKDINIECDVIIAGPPCQGFSMSGKRQSDDERNSLFKEVVRAAKALEPKFIVIENVVGLLSMRNQDGVYIKEIIYKEFEKIGYKVKHKILNAADYLVPQARKRVIFIASKNYDINFPEPIVNKESYTNVEQAISNIPNNGIYYENPKSEYQRIMSGNKFILNNEKPNHNEIVIKRMKSIPIGGNWQNIPPELGDGGGKHSNNYRRLDPNKPSITIKHATKSMIIHPNFNRGLTVRETARLQSFDDNFVLTGSKSDQHQQLANAVPPLLGKAIAETIYKAIIKK
jgi:DNA (cytosine-5)-methyltransferase 1